MQMSILIVERGDAIPLLLLPDTAMTAPMTTMMIMRTKGRPGPAPDIIGSPASIPRTGHPPPIAAATTAVVAAAAVVIVSTAVAAAIKEPIVEMRMIATTE